MPLASGLGSSGASSAAGRSRRTRCSAGRLSQRDVVLSAMEGERAASGTPHADNVAPSVMGGIVLVRSYEPFEIVPLPVPDGLHVAVVHPHCQVSTAEARRLVKDRTYSLHDVVPISATLRRSWRRSAARSSAARPQHQDGLVEPLRAPLIPGFATVKKAALGAGALGARSPVRGRRCSRLRETPAAARIGGAMQAAF